MDSFGRVAVIIPALNEAAGLRQVLPAIPGWVERVVVVDNGSTDDTAVTAAGLGATVVTASRRGYGTACLAGLALLAADPPDLVVFLDADYSDRPQEMDELLQPLVGGTADLVIGSRVARAAPGALLPQQRFGNWLATRLLRAWYGVAYTDLGPFRAIRWAALTRLAMGDPDFGWTIEMQAKAALVGLRHAEVAVSYHPRIGQSKISGTLTGTWKAGRKILGTLWRLRFSPPATWLRSDE